MNKAIEAALLEVRIEIDRGARKHGKFNSAHEGFAVLLEEVDELRSEVWKKIKLRDPRAMRAEARQVAAIAVRFMLECSNPEKDD